LSRLVTLKTFYEDRDKVLFAVLKAFLFTYIVLFKMVRNALKAVRLGHGMLENALKRLVTLCNGRDKSSNALKR
jgi:hypothetical protein